MSNSLSGIGTLECSEKIYIGGTDGAFRWNSENSKLQFTNDAGIEWSDISGPGITGDNFSTDLRVGRDTDNRINFDTDNAITFFTNGSEKIKIDSSGSIIAQDSDHTLQKNSADSDPSVISFYKSRNDTDGSHTIVQENDNLGAIEFSGSNGTSYKTSAKISARVGGIPGIGDDMPGELVFSTTKDGEGDATEQMTLSKEGNLNVLNGGITPYGATLQTMCSISVEGNNTDGRSRISFNNTSHATGGLWQIYAHSNGNEDSDLYVYSTASGDGNDIVGFFDGSAGNQEAFDFTGQHRSLMNSSISNSSYGLIVSSTGKYVNIDNTVGPRINESLPTCTISNTDNDKKVFGVISDKEDSTERHEYSNGNFVSVLGKTNGNEIRLFINSVGEGGLWICNKNGNIENGDYITTTTVTGYGGKQTMNEGLLTNHTVAKTTCDCDFSLVKTAKQKLKTINDADGNQIIDYDTDGNIQFEDDLDSGGNQQMVYPLETRFLDSNGGQLVDESDYSTRLSDGESVYIACFVGCTYHCG
jgi:hypothetical protein